MTGPRKQHFPQNIEAIEVEPGPDRKLRRLIERLKVAEATKIDTEVTKISSESSATETPEIMNESAASINWEPRK